MVKEKNICISYLTPSVCAVKLGNRFDPKKFHGVKMRNDIHKTFFLAAFLLATAAFSSECLAGAWTMPKGKMYDRFAVNYYFAEKEFNEDRERKEFANNGEFTDFNLNNYIEYGLTDRLTIINSLYYKWIKKEDDDGEDKTNGLGDVDIAVKYKLAEGSLGVFSTQLLVKIPGPYDGDDSLPLGNDQLDIEARMLYGRSLYPHIPGYCNVEFGYRWRDDDPSDELRYLIEVGVDITSHLYGRIKLDGTYSTNNGEDVDSSGNPRASNNFDLGKLDMAIGYKLPKGWGLEIGYIPEMYGRNTSTGATYSFAVTYLTP
jgi:protein XagA